MKRFLEEISKGNKTYIKNVICRKFYPVWGKHKPHLDFIGFYVVDHCILHCKGCVACAPLVKKPWFYDVKVFEKEVEELSKKLAIMECEILGGETLLHPQIEQIVSTVRKFYPFTTIILLTNGILLKKMKPSFFECLRKNNILLRISVYTPFREKVKEWVDFCKQQKCCVTTVPNYSLWYDCRYRFDIVSDPEERFKNCICKFNLLFKSKIYPCVRIFLKRFNEFFHEHIEEVPGYDVFSYSGRELQKLMNQPNPCCRRCNGPSKDSKLIPWGYSKRERSEWVVE